mgnify:CR=1 FL=1
MRRHNIIFWLFSLCAVVLSCTTDDAVSENTEEKRYEFVLSVGHQGSMRMATDIVQSEGTFRGIQKLWVIPFNTPDATAVTSSSFPLLSVVMGSETNKVNRTDNEKFYYFARCSLKETTNRVLVYGQTAPVSGKTSDDQNGKLVTGVGEEYIKPTDIQFYLQSICEEEDAVNDAKYKPARDLAVYLTAIANTEGWRTDVALKSLFFDFIHADVEETGLIAGSAANVKSYVTNLKNTLETIKAESGTAEATKTLCDAIIGNIGDVDDADACVNNGYPGSIGLPDGAAALRWNDNEKAFMVRIATTPMDNINTVKRFTYPAELWYYVNSDIMTSTTEVGSTAYESDVDWATVLGHYDPDQKTVTIDTKSVAVKERLQYGVAHLQTVLNPINQSPMYDAKEEQVNYAVGDFPLKGVIIGGQHTVGFDFKPQEPKSDLDARFIYDKEEVTSGTVNTLVLQSYDGEKVPVVLELQNNSGHKFTGRDGIVYPGTKFYLVAYLDPAGMGEGACAGRVFTQDFTTTAKMTVTSLANAYTCIPDLLEPRLEIGVKVVTQWIMSTPTTVKLE